MSFPPLQRIYHQRYLDPADAEHRRDVHDGLLWRAQHNVQLPVFVHHEADGSCCAAEAWTVTAERITRTCSGLAALRAFAADHVLPN